MSISVIGTYHSKFGALEETIYDLILNAGRGALKDSGIEADAIGAVFLGNFSAGQFVNQEHLGAMVVDIDPGLRFKPSTRLENACASGSAAIEMASYALEAGEIDYALVIGAEKMTSLDTRGVTHALATASYWPDEGANGMTFPGLFAEYAKGYMKHYDYSLEMMRNTFAQIAAKNHTNAVENPLAHMPMSITAEKILGKEDRKNPIIADPLRLFDCSLVSDGAAAMVLTKTENALKTMEEVVEISAIGHTTDYLSLVSGKRADYELTAGKLAIQKAYAKAGITVDDLDFAEVHDCFTINELLAYEAMGIKEGGMGHLALEEGIVFRDGKLPVNLSGGLKAKGHPVGTTGVSMAVLATRQLLGKAVGIQKKDAETGLTFNVGGSSASCYALVYKRIK